MTTTIFALVAAFVVAAVYFADPATANGRTNINFGGPMGSFAQPPGGSELVRPPERARRPITAPNSVRAVKPPPLPIRAIRQVSTAPAQAAAGTRKVADSNMAKPLWQMVSVSAIAALEKPLAASTGQPPPRDATKTAEAERELGCKKYVAAAGLTITVPCTK